jgi:pyruvate,water dikinase
MGYDNVEIMFPLVVDADEVERAASAMREAGIDPDTRSWGVMIETPAAALRATDLAATGIDFVSFGTNDLTQYTLAVDRNNERVADRYDALHPAVIDLLEAAIDDCREAGVSTSICGEAGSKPAMIDALVHAGIDSISVNIDAVRDAQRDIKRVEQSLLLEAARGP